MAGVPISITFYKNDNSGTTINNNLYSSNDSFTIPSINCIPGGKKDLDWTREDCNFIKWNTSADGSGISYYPEDILNPLGNYTTSEAHLNLYAIWGVIPDNSVRFKVGSQSDYDSVDKESNSLYFITDSGASKIYKGETLLATLNDDYIVNNTGNNIIVSLNNGVLSAELGESIVADIEDLSSEWGEISSAIVPYDIESNVYYDLYYIGNNIVYDDSNNNKYFKDGDNYYKTTSTEWNLRETKSGTSSQKVLLGSNIENIVHEIYSGNDPAYLCSGAPEPAGNGPITPGLGDIIIK